MPKSLTEIVGDPWWAFAVGAAALMGYLTVNALFLVWLERKVSARMQLRLGPTEVGPAGLLQTLADVVKLMGKQFIRPKNAQIGLFLGAPILVFFPVVAVLSLIPIDEGWVFHDLNIGLLLVFTFAGFGIIGVFMAGWGSNNKYALLGAMRAVAQNISYEIPLILATLSVVLMTGTMNLREIVEAQGEAGFPFLFVQPVAALIYFISATAETNRAPFDIPEAESELIAGFHTEYPGGGFAIFFLAEYTNMIIVCAVATILFLGGWSGPVLPGFVWFFLKVYSLIFVMMWFRWTFPRLRFDQLMRFAWAVLVPLAIVNLLVTATVLKVL